jgi:hypothetical protein
MSSGAAQLPRQRGGTCRHRGAVIGCRAPKTVQPERGLGRPAGGRRHRGRRGCPDAGHAVRRSLRRADVRPLGRAGVRCPRASGVQATGVIQVSGQTGVGQTGVRCPRPLRPRCPHRAGSRRSVPRDSPGLADRVRRVAVVCERLGRRCPNAAWLGRDGRALAVRGWHEGRRQAWAAASQSHRLRRRSPPGRPRELVQRQGAGRLAGEHARQVLTSPSQARLGQVAGVLLDHGRDPKVVTTLCGRCAGVGLMSSGAGGPVRFSGA